jgi:beta-fructofuranosidase
MDIKYQVNVLISKLIKQQTFFASRIIFLVFFLAISFFQPLLALSQSDKGGKASPVELFRAVVKSKDKALYSKAALELRLWMMENDPYRPIYHFTGPESWINDPNGVIFHKGMYHLFYQFDPIVDGQRSKRCWGHAASKDLVHWEDWPVALWPDTPYDQGGVYSGNMVIDDNGIPTAFYTGNVQARKETYGMQARSLDGFLTWEKKMVMHNDQRPDASSPVHWDAQIWKDSNVWHQLIGGALNGKGAAQIWTSPDLENWTYQKAIYSGDPGNFWELPYLVQFGEKYALFVGRGNPYWIGEYDRKTLTFTPDSLQTKSIDNGNYYSFNLHMTDDKGPDGEKRQLMHGWVNGPPSPTKTVPFWHGAHSIPRVITREGNRLRQEPIPEIQSLRGKHYTFSDLTGKDLLKGIKGDAFEIKATFTPGTAKRLGFRLRIAEDEKSCTRVFFDTASGTFGVDGDAVAKSPQMSCLNPGEDVQMHIFLDKSIIEVYLNGNAQTARTFPDPGSLGLGIFSEGGEAILKSLDIWEMKSMWEKRK